MFAREIRDISKNAVEPKAHGSPVRSAALGMTLCKYLIPSQAAATNPVSLVRQWVLPAGFEIGQAAKSPAVLLNPKVRTVGLARERATTSAGSGQGFPFSLFLSWPILRAGCEKIGTALERTGSFGTNVTVSTLTGFHKMELAAHRPSRRREENISLLT